MDPALLSRYHVPRPPVILGSVLIDIAHAAIDISDGLILDLERLCRASNKGALIYFDRIPISRECEKMLIEYPNYIEAILTGGDDYQLLFTAPAKEETAIQQITKELDIDITHIGEITTTKEVVVLGHDDQPMSFEEKGFEHQT